jgi:hypothetical protein
MSGQQHYSGQGEGRETGLYKENKRLFVFHFYWVHEVNCRFSFLDIHSYSFFLVTGPWLLFPISWTRYIYLTPFQASMKRREIV